MIRQILCISTLATLSLFAAEAQSPTPIIMQAIVPATAKSTADSSKATTAAAEKTPESLEAALKMLREMKSANDEMLSKQEATLQQLDELQKAAEQIKIFSKRG